MTDDPVNHPSHYTFGQIEVIEVIEDWNLDYHRGNAVKYIARAPHKGNELEDLQKARWYLDRAIENQKKGERVENRTHSPSR
jgi:hypothetical protein